MKRCSRCKKEKQLDNFRKNKRYKDGFFSWCAECEKSYYQENKEKLLKQKKEYYIDNKELILEKVKEYQNSNKEKVREKNKIYREKNKERLKEKQKIYIKKNKDKIKEKSQQYYQDNKEKIHKKQKIKRRTNHLFRTANNLRRRINHFIKFKDKSFEEIVGINLKDFLIYLESKFTDNMSWDKMGKEIHIDHIIPLSSAKNESELYKLCHYTNLQPLWAKDNLRKGKKR